MKFQVNPSGTVGMLALSEFFSIHMKKKEGLAYFTALLDFGSCSDVDENVKKNMPPMSLPIITTTEDDAARLIVMFETILDLAILAYIQQSSKAGFDGILTMVQQPFSDFLMKNPVEKGV